MSTVGAATAPAPTQPPSLLLVPQATPQSTQVVATFLATTRDFVQMSAHTSPVLLHVHSSSVVLQVISIADSPEAALILKIDNVSLRDQASNEATATAAGLAVDTSNSSSLDEPRLVVHRSGVGDSLQVAGQDLGKINASTAVEGFALILDRKSAADFEVEYKVLALNGAESPWTESPQYCGSRGRHLPLLGMAARIKGPNAAQYACEYQLAFLSGQVSTVGRNGIPVRSNRSTDPITNLSIRVIRTAPTAPRAVPASKSAAATSKGKTTAKAALAKSPAPAKSANTPDKRGASAGKAKRPVKKRL